MVLGEAVTDWRGIHLATCRGYMEINGELVGEGMGSDVMGHPLEPLAWLANNLASRGQETESGNGGHHRKHSLAKVAQAGRLGPYRNRRSRQGRTQRSMIQLDVTRAAARRDNRFLDVVR